MIPLKALVKLVAAVEIMGGWLTPAFIWFYLLLFRNIFLWWGILGFGWFMFGGSVLIYGVMDETIQGGGIARLILLLNAFQALIVTIILIILNVI